MKARYNTKLAKEGKSIGGAARFVREQIAKGVEVKAVKAAVLERWPKFQHDKAGLKSRIKMATKLVKHHVSHN